MGGHRASAVLPGKRREHLMMPEPPPYTPRKRGGERETERGGRLGERRETERGGERLGERRETERRREGDWVRRGRERRGLGEIQTRECAHEALGRTSRYNGDVANHEPTYITFY